MQDRILFKEKLSFFIESLRKNLNPLLIMLLFLFLGIGLFAIGYYGDTVVVLIMGIFFIGFSLFAISYTMPSSISYYYEKAIVKKYGVYSVANIINKEIEIGGEVIKHGKRIKHNDIYIISYVFEYKGKAYKGIFLVDYKEDYDNFEIKEEVPIRFLRINPEKSTIRMRKLIKEKELKTTG